MIDLNKKVVHIHLIRVKKSKFTFCSFFKSICIFNCMWVVINLCDSKCIFICLWS